MNKKQFEDIYNECILENKKLPINVRELQKWLAEKEYKLCSSDQRALADKLAEYIFSFYANKKN